MTPKTFYNKLEKSKSKIKWVRSHHGDEIRGTIRSGPWRGDDVCPITGVYYLESGVYVGVYSYEDAADELNLTYEFATDIAGAADNSLPNTEGASQKAKRKTLLKKLGFKVNDK